MRETWFSWTQTRGLGVIQPKGTRTLKLPKYQTGKVKLKCNRTKSWIKEHWDVKFALLDSERSRTCRKWYTSCALKIPTAYNMCIQLTRIHNACNLERGESPLLVEPRLNSLWGQGAQPMRKEGGENYIRTSFTLNKHYGHNCKKIGWAGYEDSLHRW
jgi:hypothetical protein